MPLDYLFSFPYSVDIQMCKFLLNIKPGDKVIVSSKTGVSGRDRVSKVDRVTATQVILDNKSRFRKKDGFRVGYGPWYNFSLREATEDAIAEVYRNNERNRLASNLFHADWRNMTLESLQAVWDIVSSIDKSEDEKNK